MCYPQQSGRTGEVLIAHFFIQEFQIGGALILDVSFAFVAVIRPRHITFPFLLLVVFIIVLVKRKVAVFGGFFSV